MNIDCFIINDFLDDPDAIRRWVIDNNKKGHLPFDQEGPYPGIRSDKVGNEDYHYMIEEKLKKILPFKFKMDMKTSDSYAYQLCLKGSHSSIHVDKTKWGGVLYLTPNAPLQSGTFLFKDNCLEKLKELNSIVWNTKISDEEKFKFKDELQISISDTKGSKDISTVVSNVYNRMLIMRGGEVPHSSLNSGFGDCLENGRLTQVFFFDEVIE